MSFGRQKVQSPLAASEVEARLRAITALEQGRLDTLYHRIVWDGRRPPFFVGRVCDGQFELRWLSRVRRTGTWIVTGEIQPTGQGSRIDLHLHAPWGLMATAGLVLVVVVLAVRDGGGVFAVSAGATALGVSLGSWSIGSRRVLRTIVAAVEGA